jgi:NDP-sugar pyrophosphorylase family protein
MKAVILAGGHGKRLRPLTQDRPKTLVEVGDRPIIEWQIRWLSSHGVKEFVVCAGYMKEKFFSVIGSGSKLGVKVYYSVEDEPLGTGGALKNAEGLLMNESGFLTVNGDIITSLNPTALVEQSSVGVVSLVTLKSPFGVVDLSDNCVVKGFLENLNSTTGSTRASTTLSQRSSNTYLKKATSKRQRFRNSLKRIC